MQRLLAGCERLFLMIACVTTFALMLLTTADAAGRYLFNQPITGAYELSTNYLMILLVFLGMTYCYREGGHIRVTFLADRLPPRIRWLVNGCVQLLCVVIGGLLMVATFRQARLAWESHTTLSSLPSVPLGPAYFIVPAGLLVMSLAMLCDLRQVRKGRSPLFKEETPTG